MLVALPVPVLDTMIAWAPLVCPTLTFPNDNESGEADTFGTAGATPVPLIATCAVEPPVKLNARFAASAPVLPGRYVTLSVHAAPLAIELPQVLPLTTNSVGLPLVIARPLAGAVPVFVIVTGRAPLD